jgi:hypothetical protein
MKKSSSRPKAAHLPPQWRDPRIFLALAVALALAFAFVSVLAFASASVLAFASR